MERTCSTIIRRTARGDVHPAPSFTFPFRGWFVLALIAVAIASLPGASAWLQYDRSAIAQGQWWRWIDGHFTHFGLEHLFWDLAMFVMLGGIVERRSAARFWACVIGSMLAISAAVWWAMPELMTYRGLSGVDSALFVLAVVMLIRERRLAGQWGRVAGIGLIGAAFVGKVTYEWLGGVAIFVDQSNAGFVVVPLAHVVGAAVGGLCGMAGNREQDNRTSVRSRAMRILLIAPASEALRVGGDERSAGARVFRFSQLSLLTVAACTPDVRIAERCGLVH